MQIDEGKVRPGRRRLRRNSMFIPVTQRLIEPQRFAELWNEVRDEEFPGRNCGHGDQRTGTLITSSVWLR